MDGKGGKTGRYLMAAYALAAALCLAGGSLALAEAGIALAGGGQAAGDVAVSVTTSMAADNTDGTLQAASALAVLDESSSDADDGAANEEGSTITDGQGIVYEVTAAATADEPGEAEVSDGSGLLVADATVGEVTQQVGGVTYAYAVTAVASQAFQGNGTLESIAFEGDLTGTGSSSSYGIGSYAFYGCTALTAVTLPAKTAGIASYAFAGCTVPHSETGSYSNAPMPCVPTMDRRVRESTVPGSMPCAASWRSTSRRPQPSGMLSANTPNTPSNGSGLATNSLRSSGRLSGLMEKPLASHSSA